MNKRELRLSMLLEQIQLDLLALTGGYLIDELDGYEDFEDKMCQIVINNFHKYETGRKI
tara:strand:+ start:268 stop:444 length:177 start_codon:yes stop_codon:yes gene_type:complete